MHFNIKGKIEKITDKHTTILCDTDENSIPLQVKVLNLSNFIRKTREMRFELIHYGYLIPRLRGFKDKDKVEVRCLLKRYKNTSAFYLEDIISTN